MAKDVWEFVVYVVLGVLSVVNAYLAPVVRAGKSVPLLVQFVQSFAVILTGLNKFVDYFRQHS